MTYKEKKKLLNAFVVIYLLAFLVFSWEDVSWLFSFNFIKRALSDVFQRENYQALSSPDGESLPEENKKNKQEIIEFEYSPKEDSIEIPKIEISAPIILGQSLDVELLKNDLDRGVVIYPDSVLPNQGGRTVILGHSAPPGWPKIKHDWVFSNINDLSRGDKIIVYFGHRKYSYKVKTKIFLEKGEEIPQKGLTNPLGELILVSCWPPGKDLRRIAVQADLLSPN